MADLIVYNKKLKEWELLNVRHTISVILNRESVLDQEWEERSGKKWFENRINVGRETMTAIGIPYLTMVIGIRISTSRDHVA